MRPMATRSNEPRGRAARSRSSALDGRPAAIVGAHAGPWGPIQLAATARGIVGLALLSPPDAFEADLARTARVTFDDGTPAARRHLDAVRRELDGYFAGTREWFDIPIDLRVRSDWDALVLNGVRTIGFGEAIGYGDLARRIGRLGAARAVGGALGRNPVGLLVPCHRVISGDGSLGGYGGDWYGTRDERLAIKRALLELEGVEVG